MVAPGTGKHPGHGGPKDPYHDPDYDHPVEQPTEPPVTPRYPDPGIYGSYASKQPPTYVPHPHDHSCFRPRRADYRPPASCDDPCDDGLCHRKDARRLTADEQDRFIAAYN